MKIKTITYTERKVLAQYEYAELSSVAELADGEDEAEAVIKLMEYVAAALNREMSAIKENINGKVSGKCNESGSNDGGNSQEEQIKKEDKTDKKTNKRTKKEGTTSTSKSNSKSEYVAYNRDIEAHRQLLSSHLSSKYPTWKTKEGIKEFSASLAGKDFLDENGNIVESFEKVLSDFFA